MSLKRRVIFPMVQQIMNNFPLVAAVVAVITAQILKLPVYAITDGKVDITRIFGSGGMPSSHSAFVIALVTALILQHGWTHPLVAIAIVFGFIVMYDAAGVRRESGKQATVINALLEEAEDISVEARRVLTDSKGRSKNLKELLGHEPIEIFAGAVLGIAVAIFLFRLY